MDILKTAIDKEDSFLSINEIDFGVEFDEDQISILNENCFMYVKKKLLKEMLLLLSENVKIFKVFGEFSILKCENPLTQIFYH